MQEIVFNGLQKNKIEVHDAQLNGSIQHVQDGEGYFVLVPTKEGVFNTSDFIWWTVGVQGYTIRMHIRDYLNEMSKILRGEYDDEEED